MSTSPRRFTATLAESGARAFVELPFDPDEAWGPAERHYVAGRVAGRPFRGALASTALGHILPLGPTWRRDNGLAPGDTIDVELAPEGPLIASLAADIADALGADAAAASCFRSVAPFYRKNFLRWIDGAKRPETRAARIAETVKLLAAGRIER
jgi:hypothetical protein